MAQRLAPAKPKLTKRQREVLKLVADGYTNREIAERLGISLDGAKWHVSELLIRLNADDREQLARLWPALQRDASARAWPRRLALALGVGAGGVAATVAAFFVFSSRDDEDTAPPPRPTPQSCPVDAAVCDFAREVERVYREGDLRDLLSPKSEQYPETGILRAADLALRGPLEPRVMSIGCPIDPAIEPCADGFSLVLTSYLPGDQAERERRVLLAFQRDGRDLPIINANILVGGIDAIASGGEIGRCEMSGRGPGSTCRGTRFYPWESGVEIARLPTPAPAPTSALDPLAGVPSVELKPGRPVHISPGTVVYYSDGCYGCGRPRIPGIFRTYLDSTGVQRTDDLLGPLFARVGGYSQSVAADWERGRIAVLVCATGYCGGEGDVSPDATVRLFQSRDGGVTFAEEPVNGFAPLTYLGGFADGELIVRTFESRGVSTAARYFLYPSMSGLAAPSGIGTAEPFADGAGGIAWLAYGPSNGYYDAAGGLLVPNVPGRSLVSVIGLAAGRLAAWSGNGETFGVYDGSGRLVSVLQSAFLSDIRGQLPDGSLIGNVTLPGPAADLAGGSACKDTASSYASLVDPATGEVRPIIELGGCGGPNEHHFVNAIVTRSVVRVATGDDCLNVRAEPSTAAAALGCFADGALLGVRETSPVAGWIPVTTPDGEGAGWVAEEFVKR